MYGNMALAQSKIAYQLDGKDLTIAFCKKLAQIKMS